MDAKRSSAKVCRDLMDNKKTEPSDRLRVLVVLFFAIGHNWGRVGDMPDQADIEIAACRDGGASGCDTRKNPPSAEARSHTRPGGGLAFSASSLQCPIEHLQNAPGSLRRNIQVVGNHQYAATLLMLVA